MDIGGIKVNSSIYAPVYINKNLILDLHSILINGYIESRGVRYLQDNTNAFKFQRGKKSSENKGKKTSNNDKEKNLSKDESSNLSNDFVTSLDNRNSAKNEISIKQIYTTFQIFDSLKNLMLQKNILKCIGKDNISNHNVLPQEFIELEGYISETSTLSQINTTIEILEAYDCKTLDKLLKKNEDEKEPLTNYSVILKQLKNLSTNLTKNNTVNMIMDCNSFTSVLNVNLNNFLDKNAYIYDNVHCSCKVLCRVVKVVNSDEHIDLLCKTCMSDYYCDFFKQMGPYLDLLSKKNILVPKEFTTNIKGPAIQAIPIAIYI